MHNKEIICGALWFCIAAAVLSVSVRLDIGPLQNPGPGFLAFWAATALAFLSVALFAANMKGIDQSTSLAETWKGRNWSLPLFTLAALVLYCLLLPIAGYVAATFGLMAALLGISKNNLKLAVLGALLISMLTFILFDSFLKMPLPRGFFGF